MWVRLESGVLDEGVGFEHGDDFDVTHTVHHLNFVEIRIAQLHVPLLERRHENLALLAHISNSLKLKKSPYSFAILSTY